MSTEPCTRLLCINATLHIRPERRAAFLQRIDSAQAATSHETLAHAYLYGEDESTPNTFHVHQAYLGRAGLDAHRATPHYAEWEAFAASEPFTAPVEAHIFDADFVPSAAAPSEQPVLCLNVRFAVRPERREQFLREIAADHVGTMAHEPLARAMLVGEDTSAPGTFHLHEQFCRGRAGFRAHLAAVHFAPWQAFVDSQPFEEPGLITSSYYFGPSERWPDLCARDGVA